MADVECDIRFPGLNATTGESTVTLSTGTRPSRFQMECGFNPDFVPKIGPLVLQQNGREVVRFRDCAIVEVYKSGGDLVRFNVTFEDRRWKWWQGGGTVSGKYNVRRTDGTLKPGTEKSAREMAELLLKKLGESGFDVSAVPNASSPDVSPEMDWDYRRPVEALDELLNALQLRLVLGTDDKVRIVQPGRGRNLPTQNLVDDVNEIYQNMAVPDKLLFIAGRTRWQGLLKLEAVGLDLDGKIKPIDKLSYKPSEGWESGSPQYPERLVDYGKDDKEREKARRLAKQTVWRWYRIVGQSNGKLGPVKNCPFKITSRDQYGLFQELLDTKDNDDGTQGFQPAYVVGKRYDEELDGENTEQHSRLDDGFSIDASNAVVQFGEPQYQIDDDGNYAVAELWLFTSYTLAHPDERQPHRFTKERTLGSNSGAGSLPVLIDDVFRTVKIKERWNGRQYVQEKIETNDKTLDAAADFYLKAKAVEVQPDSGQDASLGGFHNVSPDGALQQVTWSLNGGVGTTRVSRNVEHSVFVPRYELRRRAQELDKVLGDSKKKGA